MDNRVKIVGIRSKSTSNPTSYFFSVESENVDFLKIVMNHIRNTLWVHGIEYDFDKRYHD